MNLLSPHLTHARDMESAGLHLVGHAGLLQDCCKSVLEDAVPANEPTVARPVHADHGMVTVGILPHAAHRASVSTAEGQAQAPVQEASE